MGFVQVVNDEISLLEKRPSGDENSYKSCFYSPEHLHWYRYFCRKQVRFMGHSCNNDKTTLTLY